MNILAQEAGIAALSDANYLERYKQGIRQAKQFLVDELDRAGFITVPSKAIFPPGESGQ